MLPKISRLGSAVSHTLNRNLTELQSQTKYFQQYRKIQYNWTGKEKFSIYFCMFFNCYCQSLISSRETGHQDICAPKFENFLVFPNFLKSQVLTHLATLEATRIPSFLLLVIKHATTQNQPKPPTITQNQSRPPTTSQNHPKTTHNQPKSPTSSHNYPK